MQSNAAHYWNPNAAIIADAFEFIEVARVSLKVAGADAAYVQTYKPRAYQYLDMALAANARAVEADEYDFDMGWATQLKLQLAIAAVEKLEAAIDRFDSVS